MTGRQLESRNAMVDWQVAPADYLLVNFDEPKVRYRKYVEDLLDKVPQRNLKRKTFVTISTNVLCAEKLSSKETIDPIERDIYLPLEISLCKWSVAESRKPIDDRVFTTKVWILDPGKPAADGSVGQASDHKNKHKIDYDKFKTNDTYVERDLQKVVKEINEMLTPDRTVFSTQLRNCRQDLGCLKWLNRETNFKLKPIKVYSIDDLYVVLIRRMLPDNELNTHIGQGLARHRMEFTPNFYETRVKCQYHQDIVRENEDSDSRFCANAWALCFSEVLVNDISIFTQVVENDAVDELNEQLGQLAVQ